MEIEIITILLVKLNLNINLKLFFKNWFRYILFCRMKAQERIGNIALYKNNDE
jgi:hypothetical protein